MKSFLRILLQAVVVLLVTLAVGGLIKNLGELGTFERILGVLMLAFVVWLAYVFFRSRWSSFGKAAPPVLLALGIVGVCEFLYQRSDERTDRPDAELRQAILGTWRLSRRLDAEALGWDLSESSDVVLASNLEVTFDATAANSKGDHIISVVHSSVGSLEGRFDSVERDTWTIVDRRIIFSPDPTATQWTPRADHPPTQQFRARYPNWPNTKDTTPMTFDVATLEGAKMVLIHKDFRNKNKTIRTEFTYLRVSGG